MFFDFAVMPDELSWTGDAGGGYYNDAWWAPLRRAWRW
jgi:hypothetical protein